jgi:hypothetical protein
MTLIRDMLNLTSAEENEIACLINGFGDADHPEADDLNIGGFSIEYAAKCVTLAIEGMRYDSFGGFRVVVPVFHRELMKKLKNAIENS